MSQVTDIGEVIVDANASPIAVTSINMDIEVTELAELSTVELTGPGEVTSVQVDTPGIQGPPGLQNVWIGEEPPLEKREIFKTIWIDTTS